ncbi:glycosyltransferase 61 family protein [Pseudophaeobacter sp.]|uniref:glycosyltransferase family 61 protein n=1 Tax=Pseudophaeobacter sp. TaxID=1971739 RepID=UPI0032975C18
MSQNTSGSNIDPDGQPLPTGGWSEEIVTLADACVVPPKVSALVQPAGVLYADGSYCPEAALWRKFRPISIEPEHPKKVRETLQGRWLWGGVLWAHFGHFLVESSSRLWALPNVEEDIRGIIFIPKRPKVGKDVRGYHREYLSLFGTDLPIQVVDTPTRVEELVVPGQGFGLGKITVGTRKFRRTVHDRFATHVEAEGPEKIYISRSKLGLGKGGLLGEEQLETLLEAEGYEIFHPQEHSLTVQVARYKAAKKVIAADGSALHLFAMVGGAEQKVAMILRRSSGANNLLAKHVESFCKCNPVVIGGLRAEWVPEKAGKSNRLSFGELNHQVIGETLSQHGFISETAAWQVLSEDERNQILQDKGLGGQSGFVEAKPKRKRDKAS